MTGQNPDAGWYPDPAGSGQRWWDGERWTDATRDPAPSPMPPPVAPPVDEQPRPTPTNKRRAVIAGIAGVVVIGAAAAIVLPRVLGGGDTYTVTGTVEVPAPDFRAAGFTARRRFDRHRFTVSAGTMSRVTRRNRAL